MSKFSQLLFLAPLSLALICACFDSLDAYVTVPRNIADTTQRMNTGGDPATRPGMLDEQRSPEYLDDWWGVNDYYYSQYGIHETGSIRNPGYDSYGPPYYPLPNNTAPTAPTNTGYYNYNTRNYQPGYPRGL